MLRVSFDVDLARRECREAAGLLQEVVGRGSDGKLLRGAAVGDGLWLGRNGRWIHADPMPEASVVRAGIARLLQRAAGVLDAKAATYRRLAEEMRRAE